MDKEQDKLILRRIRIVSLIIAAILTVVAIFTLYGCNRSYEDNKIIKAVDGTVYTFIVGKVEGNDDLLDSVLTDDAKGILKPGRHAYPGDAEKMGERYEITRYTNEYENGALFYKVKFFRPSTGKVNHYNVLVVSTDDGWLVAENSSVDEMVMAMGMKEEKGKVVHRWKE